MATAEVFDHDLIDDDPLYEVIDGVKVELPPMSTLATIVANRIVISLQHYGRTSQSGQGYMEPLIRLPLKRSRQRRPDVMFVSFDRWPADRPIHATENAWEVVPDAAIEVVSPSDFADEILEKIQEYFEAGVRSVWVVYPRAQLIHRYDDLKTIRCFAAGDMLEGGSALPGYRQPVSELFPPTIHPTLGNGQ